MMSREVGSAAVIRGSAGSPRRPTPRPTGPRYPLVGPCAYPERLLVHGDRLVRPTGGLVGQAEVIAAVEGVGVVGAELRRPQPERLLVHRDRLVRPPGVHVGQGEVIAGR